MNLYNVSLYAFSCKALFDDMHDFSMINGLNFLSSRLVFLLSFRWWSTDSSDCFLVSICDSHESGGYNLYLPSVVMPAGQGQDEWDPWPSTDMPRVHTQGLSLNAPKCCWLLRQGRSFQEGCHRSFSQSRLTPGAVSDLAQHRQPNPHKSGKELQHSLGFESCKQRNFCLFLIIPSIFHHVLQPETNCKIPELSSSHLTVSLKLCFKEALPSALCCTICFFIAQTELLREFLEMLEREEEPVAILIAYWAWCMSLTNLLVAVGRTSTDQQSNASMCLADHIKSSRRKFEMVSSLECSALPTRWPPRTSIFCYFAIGCGCVSLKLSKIFTVLWYVVGCLGCGGRRREETIALVPY